MYNSHAQIPPHPHPHHHPRKGREQGERERGLQCPVSCYKNIRVHANIQYMCTVSIECNCYCECVRASSGSRVASRISVTPVVVLALPSQAVVSSP